MPTTRRRPTRIQTKRWLWTHPSHLEWWYGPNLRKYPYKKTQITGIINTYVEETHKVRGVPTDSEQHHNKWKDFAEEMGWDYIPGKRFTHTKVNKYSRSWLFDPKNHEAMVEKANKWGRIALDMEPYGITGFFKYHTQSEAVLLDKAARAWNRCEVPVAIYPSLFTAPEIILSNCLERIVLDHTTYNAKEFHPNLKETILANRHYTISTRCLPTHMIGLYLAYLKNRTVMNIVRSFGLWFYPRVKDDRRNFFTPSWSPVE